METLSKQLITRFAEARMKVAAAESCTGGMVSARLIDVPGSSAVVERGFVVYSNEAKTEMLGVPSETIAKWGAVSEQVARAMAEGALVHSHADITVAITGVAGPGGGTADKPVGLVHFATAQKGGETKAGHQIFEGNRTEVRAASADHAMTMLLDRLDGI